MAIRKAERRKARLRLALTGVSGSGKTWSALTLARGLGGKIGMIDTEAGSSELYAPSFDFDVLDIAAPFACRKYIEAIREFEKAGYDIVVIDSLSHAWSGSGGCLEQHERSTGSNSFMNWRGVSRDHNALVEAMLQSKCHIIATMRSKAEYAIENANGKQVPKKIGMASIQREGMDYEFTVCLDIEHKTHIASTNKDRTGLFRDPAMITADHGKLLNDWLNSGVEQLVAAPVAQPAHASEIEGSSTDVY